MNLELIKKLSEIKGIEIKKLALGAGMSEPNLHRCIRENKIQASNLEKIAQILEVSVSYFFEEKQSVNNNGHHNPLSLYGSAQNYEGMDSHLLKELLKTKDELIEYMRKRIKELEEK